MNTPLVSIILPTYNRSSWLPQSIGSVISQTYRSWELIVWDDGSMDNTRDVVFSYQDNRVNYYYDDNHGKSYALNKSLSLANGQYIAILDDDDQWFPEKLSQQVEAMEKHPEVDLLFSDFNNINLANQIEEPYFSKKNKILQNLNLRELSKRVYLVTAGIPEQLLISNFILPSSILMRRTTYVKTGNFNEQLRNGEDLEYWWRIGLSKAQFAYYDEILLNRFKPPNSLSSISEITYLNHINALNFCYEETLQNHQGKLIPYFHLAYKTSWNQLLRLYASNGQTEQARIAFKKLIRYGLTWQSFYFLLGAFTCRNRTIFRKWGR